VTLRDLPGTDLKATVFVLHAGLTRLTGTLLWQTALVCAAGPAGPCAPVAPVAPLGPAGPCGPIAPVCPAGPLSPLGPADPVGPWGPCGPAAQPQSVGVPGQDGSGIACRSQGRARFDEALGIVSERDTR
jgi:hypothetical protein